MFRISCLISEAAPLSLAWLVAAASACAQGASPTTEALIDRMVEAGGGAAVHERLPHRIVRGRFELLGHDGKYVGSFVAAYAHPDTFSQRLTFEGVFDGVTKRTGVAGDVAWGTAYIDYPIGPTVWAGPLQAAAFRRLWTLHPAARWRDWYASAVRLDDASVEGRACHRLAMIPDDGLPAIWCIDADTGRLLEVATILEVPQGVQRIVDRFFDYRAVAGVPVAHRIQRFVDGIGSVVPSIPFRRPPPAPRADYAFELTIEQVEHRARRASDDLDAPADAISAATALAEQLTAAHPNDRRLAAGALATLGADGTDSAAVAALITALRDQEPAVQRTAAMALGAIGDPAAAAALERMMRADEVPDNRWTAATALGRLDLSASRHSSLLAPRSGTATESCAGRPWHRCPPLQTRFLPWRAPWQTPNVGSGSVSPSRSAGSAKMLPGQYRP